MGSEMCIRDRIAAALYLPWHITFMAACAIMFLDWSNRFISDHYNNAKDSIHAVMPHIKGEHNQWYDEQLSRHHKSVTDFETAKMAWEKPL